MHVLRAFVDDFLAFLDSLLNLANRLIPLAFIAKLVVISQRTRRFLDSTLYDVCLATHDDVPFNLSGMVNAFPSATMPTT
jgi:hypothetical protein